MIKKTLAFTATGLGMLLLVLVGGCSNCQSIPAYNGQVKSLQEVAVLRTSEETCPIIRIDGVSVGKDYKAGNEYHLLPGEHTIQVVNTIGDCDTYCKIEFTDLRYDFHAGWMYAILQTEMIGLAAESKNRKSEPQISEKSMIFGFREDSRNDVSNSRRVERTLCVKDQGDVVSFAAEHPEYFKDSPAWKKLRKENGLSPSLFERFKLQLVAWGFIKPDPITVAEKKPVESF